MSGSLVVVQFKLNQGERTASQTHLVSANDRIFDAASEAMFASRSVTKRSLVCEGGAV